MTFGQITSSPGCEPGNRNTPNPRSSAFIRVLFGKSKRFLAVVALLAVWVLGLSGCVTLKDPEASLEYSADVVARINATNSAGLTFVSRRPHLNGVQLWLRQTTAPADPNAQVTVELYHAPGDTHPLASIPLQYAAIRRAFPVTITFPPQDDPPEQAYYLRLKTADGALEIFGRSEDVYPWGELWVNDQPAAADVAFRAAYDYDFSAVLADLGQALSGAWLALPLLLALWLPGRLVVACMGYALRRGEHATPLEMDWGQRTALSVGLSLALAPLLFLWTTTLGLHWSRPGIIVLYGLMAVALGALLYYQRAGRSAPPPISPESEQAQDGADIALPASPRQAQRAGRAQRTNLPPADAEPASSRLFSLSAPDFNPSGTPAGTTGAALGQIRFDWHSLALLAIFIFSLVVRQAFVRDLAAPAWVDPIHHATIARLIVEQGAFPESYEKYVLSSATSYHPGFHTIIAIYHWLSGQQIPDAMLLVGQVMNALCVLVVYLFTTSLSKDRLAGVVAALITGLLSPLPQYYGSWGRYTQLAGLLILPACLYLIQLILDRPWPSPRAYYLVAALACAGLFLTHYRVVIFLACLLLAHLFAETLRTLDKIPIWKSVPFLAGSTGIVAGVAVLLSLPWWPTLLSSMIAPSLSRPAPSPQPLFIDWNLLTPGYGRQVLIFAAVGLVWSVVRARWFGPMLALWTGLLFITANQGVIHLPLIIDINKMSVEIMLFMPCAALGGFLAADLLELWERLAPQILKKAYWVLVATAAAVLAVGGAQRILPLLNPVTVLFRQADRPAMAWVAANLPADATVMINSFLWGYGLYAGQDGGFWITPAAGRKTLPPPVVYGVSNKENITRITQASRTAIQNGKDPAALHTLLAEQGIDYVYIGARGGALSPKALSASPLFETLYAKDGVWIFHAR